VGIWPDITQRAGSSPIDPGPERQLVLTILTVQPRSSASANVDIAKSRRICGAVDSAPSEHLALRFQNLRQIAGPPLRGRSPRLQKAPQGHVDVRLFRQRLQLVWLAAPAPEVKRQARRCDSGSTRLLGNLLTVGHASANQTRSFPFDSPARIDGPLIRNRRQFDLQTNRAHPLEIILQASAHPPSRSEQALGLRRHPDFHFRLCQFHA